MPKPACLAISILLAMASAHAVAGNACIVRSGTQVMPLVELYTSEGCSSCPPADRWLSASVRDDDANFLAFHVDYWDAIGWPDRFASPRFSRRQRMRVDAVGQRTVYTPQVMVGDEVQASWRSAGAWRKTLARARRTATAALTMRLVPNASGWQATIGAAPLGAVPAGATLWVARYIDGQASDVRAGENRGATLHHDRVVRQLSGPWPLPLSGALSRQLELPAESAPWGLTAFVQDARGDVLQSLNVQSLECGDAGEP